MKKDKLHNIKNEGFKTPEGYFDTFEDKLMDRLNLSDTLSKINNSGFKVPNDYFKKAETEILNKVKENDTPVIQLFSRRQLYYVASMAASIILMLAIFINKPFEEELSIEMVENYLENRDLSSYELAELLADSDLLEDDFVITETSFEEDNLESYLLKNSEIDLIIE
ncbi:hypothetical protein [Winogradskyella alexanderae]|uniref:Uncharacterized protein n=1 Tax=Winogradskyella alexanderae TaxID=2877123 RepID=A0ABS7XRV1_9FLAO|nr:hypothetical protein [Winogradskyella alexanderae]MCA0132209.1 hypothetical protein [Winogradskyella alexanderae]